MFPHAELVMSMQLQLSAQCSVHPSAYDVDMLKVCSALGNIAKLSKDDLKTEPAKGQMDPGTMP